MKTPVATKPGEFIINPVTGSLLTTTFVGELTGWEFEDSWNIVDINL